MTIPLFHFYFKPNNGYFVYTPSGWRSEGITQLQALQLKLDAESASYPRKSYGIDNTYVTVNSSGQVWHSLNGKYPLLEQMLRNLAAPVEMIAINPYLEGSFLLIYKRGAGYLCRLPLAYESTVVEHICQGMLPMLQQAQRQQAQTNDFLLNLLANRF